MTWQPIETAPKDGTRILLFVCVEAGSEDAMDYGSPGGWQYIEAGQFDDGDWQTEHWGNVTHWMPLPQPPETAK